MGVRNDYRVSTLVVLCKDCNQDVGLYPARHKCSSSNKLPQLPKLCSSTTSCTSWNSLHEPLPDLVESNSTSTTVTRQASDSSIESVKWGFFKNTTTSDVKTDEQDESVYFSSSSINTFSNGKNLWGKMKDNEKWKALIAEKKEESTKSGKLWERIIHATIPNPVEENGPESDDDDWEGETHVSRILREYHQSIDARSLPSWLYDDYTPTSPSIPNTEHVLQGQAMHRQKSSRARRLWQAAETQHLSSREKEIQALRTERPEPASKSPVLRSQSERMPSYASPWSNQFESDQIYGSTTPRRMNTTRLPPHAHYNKETNYNIPSSPIRNDNYF